MRRSTSRAAVAGALLLLTALVGCGGDSGSSDSAADSPEPTETTETTASGSEEYCASLEEAKAQFESLDNNELANFEQTFDTLRTLGDQAPEEVAADWETLITFFDGLEQAVEDAGLTFEDLAKLQQGQGAPPPGVDPAALQELATTVQGLATPEFEAAGKAIDTHAKDECGISLSGSSSSSDSGSDQQSQ